MKTKDSFVDLVTETKIINGVVLHKRTDGLWRDRQGTVWGVQDPMCAVDTTNDCGVGELSFKNDACFVHDQQYSNPTYQTYHTRSESDLTLFSGLKQRGVSLLVAQLCYKVVRLFGGFFWENKDTRDK